MVNENLCPVCGYEMSEPPKDYNVCPSCGTEFGHHDVNASIQDLRDAWLQPSPKWWSKTDPQPDDWNPFSQVARVGHGSFVVGRSVYSITAGSTIGEIQAPDWVAAFPRQIDAKHEVVP